MRRIAMAGGISLLLLLGPARAEPGKKKGSKARVNEARGLMKAGDHAEAFDMLRPVLRARPKHKGVLKLAMVALYRAGRYSACRKITGRLLAVDPENKTAKKIQKALAKKAQKGKKGKKRNAGKEPPKPAARAAEKAPEKPPAGAGRSLAGNWYAKGFNLQGELEGIWHLEISEDLEKLVVKVSNEKRTDPLSLKEHSLEGGKFRFVASALFFRYHFEGETKADGSSIDGQLWLTGKPGEKIPMTFLRGKPSDALMAEMKASRAQLAAAAKPPAPAETAAPKPPAATGTGLPGIWHARAVEKSGTVTAWRMEVPADHGDPKKVTFQLVRKKRTDSLELKEFTFEEGKLSLLADALFVKYVFSGVMTGDGTSIDGKIGAKRKPDLAAEVSFRRGEPSAELMAEIKG